MRMASFAEPMAFRGVFSSWAIPAVSRPRVTSRAWRSRLSCIASFRRIMRARFSLLAASFPFEVCSSAVRSATLGSNVAFASTRSLRSLIRRRRKNTRTDRVSTSRAIPDAMR